MRIWGSCLFFLVSSRISLFLLVGCNRMHEFICLSTVSTCFLSPFSEAHAGS